MSGYGCYVFTQAPPFNVWIAFKPLLQEKGNEGPPAFHDTGLWVRDIKDKHTHVTNVML